MDEPIVVIVTEPEFRKAESVFSRASEVRCVAAPADEPQLAAAGYTSKLVPLFARPAADGNATGKQIEGVKKGADYVGQLTPRVRSLLDLP